MLSTPNEAPNFTLRVCHFPVCLVLARNVKAQLQNTSDEAFHLQAQSLLEGRGSSSYIPSPYSSIGSSQGVPVPGGGKALRPIVHMLSATAAVKRVHEPLTYSSTGRSYRPHKRQFLAKSIQDERMSISLASVGGPSQSLLSTSFQLGSVPRPLIEDVEILFDCNPVSTKHLKYWKEGQWCVQGRNFDQAGEEVLERKIQDFKIEPKLHFHFPVLLSFSPFPSSSFPIPSPSDLSCVLKKNAFFAFIKKKKKLSKTQTTQDESSVVSLGTIMVLGQLLHSCWQIFLSRLFRSWCYVFEDSAVVFIHAFGRKILNEQKPSKLGRS